MIKFLCKYHIICSAREVQVVCPSKSITAEEKKDVILQCLVEPWLDMSNLTLEWKHQDKLVHLYRRQRDYLNNQDSKFKGRTFLFHKEMVQGNISLKLTEISKEDAGKYTTGFPSFPIKWRRELFSWILVSLSIQNRSSKTHKTCDVILKLLDTFLKIFSDNIS